MVRALSLLLLLLGLAAGRAPAQGMTGSVHAVDGGALEGVRVRAACGGVSDSAVVDSAGGFALSLPCPGGAPAMEIVDPSGRYLPSLPRVRPRTTGGAPLFLLVPRAWRIGSGTHAGLVVPVDLKGATAPACRGCSAFYTAEDTVRVPPGIPSWLETSLPLRVAFSKEDGIGVTEADSAAFMAVTQALEDDLGGNWFQPGSYAQIFDAPPEDRFGAVIVVIDPLLETIGRGNWVSQRGEIVAGIIHLQSSRHIRDPGSAGVVAHELMHTLGFGHTCSWRTVMAAESCQSRQMDEPTAADVAHAQLLLRLRTLERRYGIYGTVSATLAGMARYPDVPAPAAPPEGVTLPM